ncbi:MAG: glycoside hydrolase family 65 protein [Lachnospiraceae bacterium]|nr:glycoside hydrolase family 65 protein [Lachnospiraceae bacterium]
MIYGKEPVYPVEPWTITERVFDRRTNYRNETTFSLANGYIGTRGTFEEGYDFDIDTGLEGNFVNGFYESEKIRYGEANFGSPAYSQSMLNLPNLKETKLYLDGEEFSMERGTVEGYARTLHMKDGFLERSLVWTSPEGKAAEIRIGRLVSFEMEHIMAIRYEVTPLNFSGNICFASKLQGDVENHTRKTNPIVDYGPFGRKLEKETCLMEDAYLYYEGTTQTSRLSVGCGSSHRIFKVGKEGGGVNRLQPDISGEVSGLEAVCRLDTEARQNEMVILEKMICYATSLDMEKQDLEAFVREEAGRAQDIGYERLKKLQADYMHRFWEAADIRITGEESGPLMQGLHFNLFHIIQSAGRSGKTGMGAKGLSGEGYEGHYFWDTEMYVLPVFVYTEPEEAKRLLDYRFATLDRARERARILGHDKGALFPWRTINGEEASTYYPLGTAQYHINADVAYALSLYLQATGNGVYLKEKGAEILIETARVWADVGSFAECRGGKYCICSVTGPDEYNVLVDNNFYTNLMARENLRDAAEAVRWMMVKEPEAYGKLKKKLSFEEEELELWDRIIENMYFPYDEKRKIYPMDDGFLMRKPWDEEKIPAEKRAWLYENYHPLFIMRHRMSKQADAILGMYLHSNLFAEEEIRRNYDFYQEVTLHHSSLSTCIFGIVACGIGYVEEGYRYFMQSARMDLDDYHNNFYAGIHAANMAGTWQAVANGFGGMRCQGGKLSFRPVLPKEWESFSFRIRYQGNLLEISVAGESGAEKVKFTLLEGDGICFYLRGEGAEQKIEITTCKGEWSGNV